MFLSQLSFVDAVIVIPLVCDFFLWPWASHVEQHTLSAWSRALSENSNTPSKRSVPARHILYCLLHLSESPYLGFQI